MYDIIGDVHGQAAMLKDLLSRMGYKPEYGVYKHPERTAVFVGDFINRGPSVRETIRIIRRMVEAGSAKVVLGNHEINALYYALRDKKGEHLSKKWSRLRMDLNQTLSEFRYRMGEWNDHLEWMRTLPMFLELDGIRVVHACWTDENIQILKENLPEGKLKKKFLKMVGKNGNEVSRAFWQTCKGIDFHLPTDLLVFDKEGCAHRVFRSRWWENPLGMTFDELSFESRFSLPKYQIPEQIIEKREPYPENAPIVFFGHYCMRDYANIIKPNICCLDSCVSRKGKLTAYQWNGEEKLIPENLFS